MSRLTDMVTNVGLQWVPLVYLLLSCVTSLSNAVTLCVMLFCFIEVLAHTCAGFMTLHWYKKDGKRRFTIPDLPLLTRCSCPAAFIWLSA